MAERSSRVEWRRAEDGTIEVADRATGRLSEVDASGRTRFAGEIPRGRPRPPHEWRTPSRLDGWVPATLEQLRAIEEVADKYGGVAYVRDDGSGAAEVSAWNLLWRLRASVDVVGTVTPLDAETRSFNVPVLMRTALFPLIVAAVVIWAGHGRPPVVLAVVAVLLALLFLSARRGDISGAHLVRTIEEADD